VTSVDTSGTSYDGALRGWKTMGSLLAASLGERYLAIGTTAYAGRIGNPRIHPPMDHAASSASRSAATRRGK
jgi:erythromycin esterase-like protein